MDYRLVATKEEKSLFIESWKESFGRDYGPEVYSWMFNDRNIMYAIFDKDKIAAGYCLLKNKVVINNNLEDGALCNNVFVHPDYRGLSLFVKLGRYALNQAGEAGIKIVIGIPNKNAVPGHRRVGWTFLNEINFLEKDIVGSLEKPSHDNIKIIDRDNFHIYGERLEEFSKKIASKRTFSVVKDKEYFRWRYVERPKVDYRIRFFVEEDVIQGYIVYKVYRALNRIHIVDVEAANEDVLYALIELADSFDESLEIVNVWNSSIYNDYFLKAGFKLSSESNNLIAIKPQVKQEVLLGDKVNIVLGDNEVV